LASPGSNFEGKSERCWSSPLQIYNRSPMFIELACESAIVQAPGIHSG
jgi:hypothetical protein